MESNGTVGHDWVLQYRPGGPGPSHYYIYTCSRCRVTQTASAGSKLDPRMKVTIPWPRPWDRTPQMTCEEVQVWNIHNQ